MIETRLPGAHWPALLTPVPGEVIPDIVERQLERALAAADAVAWDWELRAGSSPPPSAAAPPISQENPAGAFLALVHPADRDWLRQDRLDRIAVRPSLVAGPDVARIGRVGKFAAVMIGAAPPGPATLSITVFNHS